MRYSLVFLVIMYSGGCFTGLKAASFVEDSQLYKVKADSCVQALDYNCAIEFYARALSFQQGDSSLTEHLAIHNQIGDIYYKQGYFSRANESYALVINIADKHGVIDEKAKALMGQSHILWRYGDNVRSINNILESISLFKSIRDTVRIVSASNILGGIYLSTNETKKAKAIYDEALAIAIAVKDSAGMASSYEYLGVVEFFEGHFKRAIYWYEKSLRINIEIGNEVDAGITYGNIGEAYMRLSSFKSALDYFSTAEDILTKHNFNSGLIFINYSAGESLMELGKHRLAHDRFEKSLALISLTGENRERPTVLGLISKCYAAEGKFKEAYAVQEAYAMSKDSLQTTNQNEELMQIMGKYEFEKKEQENQFLQKENKIKEQELNSKQSVILLQYLIGGILLIFLVIVLYLFIKLYRNKILLDYSNQAKNKLFGFIAHDIKSPLGTIQMLIHLLEQNPADDQKRQSKLLYELSQCAYAVTQLTDDLITWSVTQRNGLELHPENVVLGEVAKDSLELFETQIKFKRLAIKNQIPPYLQVYVDKKALLSIIRNLLSNAVKFSEYDGVITLKANEILKKGIGKAMVELRVKDDGIGMSSEKAQSLMSDTEYQTTRGTANEKGSGMGLNLVKEFLQKSKGHMKVKSKPGEGARFSIFLPADKN